MLNSTVPKLELRCPPVWATLCKTAGKDADHDKPTYVALMGLERSRAYAATLAAQAHAALQGSGLPDTSALAALADMVIHRVH